MLIECKNYPFMITCYIYFCELANTLSFKMLNSFQSADACFSLDWNSPIPVHGVAVQQTPRATNWKKKAKTFFHFLALLFFFHIYGIIMFRFFITIIHEILSALFVSLKYYCPVNEFAFWMMLSLLAFTMFSLDFKCYVREWWLLSILNV